MRETHHPSDVDVRRVLERLADVELAERLRDENCGGPLWQMMREDLARCALTALGRTVPDRSGIASRALMRFRDVAILGRAWRPAEQSLRELVVALCLAERPPPVDPDDHGGDPGVVEWTRALRALPEPLRSAAWIRLDTGRTWPSIAPDVRTTASRLENQLGLLRSEHGRRTRRVSRER